MGTERQAFNRLRNFVYPSKHCCPKGPFLYYLIISCSFYFLSLLLFFLILNIEFQYPYTHLALLSTHFVSLILNFLFSFLRLGNTDSYLIYTVPI